MRTGSFVLLLLLAGLTSAPLQAGRDVPLPDPFPDYPEHRPEDPSAPVVTRQNLMAHEAFWPPRVTLQKPLLLEDRDPLAAGTTGVLIRVERGDVARIDFGRYGLHSVPLDHTDLVANVNRIRTGELRKLAPNFLLTIGPRLVDAASDPPRALRYHEVNAKDGFLVVIADPAAEEFPSVAEALAPLRDRPRVLTLLLPQGGQPDPAVRERLRALGWPVPFMYGHLSGPYSELLLPRKSAPPALLLLSREGRLLFHARFQPRVVSELALALDEAFPSTAPEDASARAAKGPARR